MTPQEREIIGGIFDKLRSAEGQQRDPQAEAFIAERVKAQPYATYVLAQAVYVQEQALTNQQQQIEQMQQEIQRLQSQPQGGFLSSLFGGGRQQAPAPQPYQQQPMGQPMGAPMQGQPGGPWNQQQPQRGGSGFLGTAAAAAVGVAGGMLAAHALSQAFGGGSAQAAAPSTPAASEPANSWEQGGQDQGWDQGGGWDSGGDFNADDI
jgi:hypothetical protein